MKAFKIGRGRSFKGLVTYLVNPKREGDGSDRALWSEVINIGASSPQTAAKVMAATAMHADELKALAGVRKGGNNQKHGPVLHLVMSWEEGESPTPEHQREAVHGMLRAVGLQDAQAVAVAHNDNGHDHVHIALNMVRPDRGTLFDLSDDVMKMQAWALEYEKANGGIVTLSRADHADRRAQGEQITGQRRLSRDEYAAMSKAANDDWSVKKAARDDLFTQQQTERADLRARQDAQAKEHKAAYARVFRAALSVAKAEDKIANKAIWRDMFRRHQAERVSAGNLVWNAEARLKGAHQITDQARRLLAVSERFEKSFLARKILAPLGFKITSDGPRATLEDAKRREGEVRSGLERAKADLATLPARQEAERKATAGRLSAATFDRVKAALSAINATDFATMIDKQNAERRQQIDLHNAQRIAVGMKPYEPKSKEAQAMESDWQKKQQDISKNAFQQAVDRRKPKEQEIPKVQGAAYVIKGPDGTSRPGATPGAPDPENKPAPLNPNDKTRTTFDKADLNQAAGFNPGRRRDDRAIPKTPETPHQPSQRRTMDQINAERGANAKSAFDKLNTPEAMEARKAARMQRAQAVAKAKAKNGKDFGNDM